MVIDFLRKLLLLAVFCLAQVLVLNHIHLFGVATPLLYAYFVLMFRADYPRWGIIMWSFVLGVVLDMFSNTPGVAAASLTLLGVLQPYILSWFTPRGSAPDMLPSMNMLGATHFYYYAIVSVTLYCIVFFSLEMFNFFNWLYWLECVAGSIAVTSVLLLVIENVRSRR